MTRYYDNIMLNIVTLGNIFCTASFILFLDTKIVKYCGKKQLKILMVNLKMDICFKGVSCLLNGTIKPFLIGNLRQSLLQSRTCVIAMVPTWVKDII